MRLNKDDLHHTIISIRDLIITIDRIAFLSKIRDPLLAGVGGNMAINMFLGFINNINITTYSRTFSLEQSDIKKKLYSFKIQL